MDGRMDSSGTDGKDAIENWLFKWENLFLSHLTKKWAVCKGVHLDIYYSVF
jgi:hypothetical protein